MSLTGIRDIDIEILLHLKELSKVSLINKYLNKLCEHDDFCYRRIMNKIIKAKTYNFSKVKDLINVSITAERIRDMQKYFGFVKLKDLDNFLNRLPINSLYQEYAIFEDHDDNEIKIIYNIDMHKYVFPEYINREKLIYKLRRSFTINNYKPVEGKNRFEHKQFSFDTFNLIPFVTRKPNTFEALQKMGVYDI